MAAVAAVALAILENGLVALSVQANIAAAVEGAGCGRNTGKHHGLIGEMQCRPWPAVGILTEADVDAAAVVAVVGQAGVGGVGAEGQRQCGEQDGAER